MGLISLIHLSEFYLEFLLWHTNFPNFFSLNLCDDKHTFLSFIFNFREQGRPKKIWIEMKWKLNKDIKTNVILFINVFISYSCCVFFFLRHSVPLCSNEPAREHLFWNSAQLYHDSSEFKFSWSLADWFKSTKIAFVIKNPKHWRDGFIFFKYWRLQFHALVISS